LLPPSDMADGGRWLVGAVLAGVVVGVVARLLMRVVRAVAGGDGDFTWSGSLFIPLIYAAAMIPGGIVAALTIRWRRWLALLSSVAH
jgi:hypothetical protein